MNRVRIGLPILFCCLLSAGIPEMAARAADVATSQPLPTQLDDPYVDGSFGFSMRAPVGSTITREKNLSGVADVQIVQFSDASQQWTLTVNYTKTTQPLDKQALSEGITKGIGTRFEDVKPLRGDDVRIDSREGFRYAASFVYGDGSVWLRQQAVIRVKPTEYFGVIFITPYGVRDWAEKLFDGVVGSFRIVRTEAMSKRIDEGLNRGKLLLQAVTSSKTKLSDRIVPESFMRFLLDGKELGYVCIREHAFVHHKRNGIQIDELAYLFKEDGSITQLLHQMRLTDDLTFENWENRVKTLLPAEGSHPQRVTYQVDSGLRQEFKLIVAFMPAVNAIELQDRIFDVEEGYASAAWNTLISRVVDLKRPELYAFSSYSADRRGMVLRTFEVIGPSRVSIGGKAVPAIKLQDSEGLLPPISEMYVDDKGKILRLKSGPLEMISATKQELEARYAKRATEAEALFKKYPVREPQPAQHERETSPLTAPQPTPGAPAGPGAKHE